MTRLYGMTLPPSTAIRGVESWIAWLAVRPVKATPSPAMDLVSTIHGQRSGPSSFASLPRQTFLGFGGKTSGGQSSMPSGWSRATLRASDSELRLALSLLRMSGPHTGGSDFLFWATPSARDADHSEKASEMFFFKRSLQARGKPLTEQAATWRMPGPLGETTGTHGATGLVLNQRFTESLMGLPEGWAQPFALAASDFSETASSPNRPPPPFSSASGDF